jgi:hypothetical protein
MIVVFLFLLLFIIGVAILTGRGRHSNVYGPPIWRWAEWKAHWRPGRSPLSDPLYRALPQHEWLTCDEIFARVSRSVIGRRDEVPARMDGLVHRKLAERHLPSKRRFLWIK